MDEVAQDNQETLGVDGERYLSTAKSGGIGKNASMYFGQTGN